MNEHEILLELLKSCGLQDHEPEGKNVCSICEMMYKIKTEYPKLWEEAGCESN